MHRALAVLGSMVLHQRIDVGAGGGLRVTKPQSRSSPVSSRFQQPDVACQRTTTEAPGAFRLLGRGICLGVRSKPHHPIVRDSMQYNCGRPRHCSNPRREQHF
eukprot:UN2269